MKVFGTLVGLIAMVVILSRITDYDHLPEPETDWREYTGTMHVSQEMIRQNDKIIIATCRQDSLRLKEYNRKMLKVIESKQKVQANHGSIAIQVLLDLAQVQEEYLPSPRFRKD